MIRVLMAAILVLSFSFVSGVGVGDAVAGKARPVARAKAKQNTSQKQAKPQQRGRVAKAKAKQNTSQKQAKSKIRGRVAKAKAKQNTSQKQAKSKKRGRVVRATTGRQATAQRKLGTRLHRLGYGKKDARAIMRSVRRGHRVVVVGENMRRVNAAARMIRSAGGKPVTYSPKKITGPNKKSLEANRSWLRYWVKGKKAKVIDIGRQPTFRKHGPSKFYGLEHRSIQRWGIKAPQNK